MVVGFGEATGLDDHTVNALRTALSEASNNVVLHAYDGHPGPLTVSLATLPGGLDAVVQDRGTGIRRIPAFPERTGLGLAVMSSLADRAAFADRAGGGTDVRLSFHGQGAGAPEHQAQPPDADGPPAGLDGDVVGSVAPAEMLPHILGRLALRVGAQFHFRVSRLEELGTVTGVLAAHVARCPPDGVVSFAVEAASRRLKLSVGPLGPLTSEAGSAAPDAPLSESDFGGLIDGFELRDQNGRQFVDVLFLDHRPEDGDGDSAS
jgi:serine/threonine-protein kinase RsbW